MGPGVVPKTSPSILSARPSGQAVARRWGLLEGRIIRRLHEGRLHAILHRQRAARLLLGGFAGRQPVRVFAKCIERSLGRIHTLVSEDVDQRAVGAFLILKW